ncbi:hypothetical protein PoB_000198100 [Plakobranchus ocellatus]|uniref:Uncharacterized protein n=1 Tax=Plakobranchus ocellatus TaxID=259542 RepID=A0AAV3XZJ1_9GAST|nr:hypothetical protein PoB_000198100 [Plakobranchus ocellatus]
MSPGTVLSLVSCDFYASASVNDVPCELRAWASTWATRVWTNFLMSFDFSLPFRKPMLSSRREYLRWARQELRLLQNNSQGLKDEPIP